MVADIVVVVVFVVVATIVAAVAAAAAVSILNEPKAIAALISSSPVSCLLLFRLN